MDIQFLYNPTTDVGMPLDIKEREKVGLRAGLLDRLVCRCTKLVLTCALGVTINSHQENSEFTLFQENIEKVLLGRHPDGLNRLQTRP